MRPNIEWRLRPVIEQQSNLTRIALAGERVRELRMAGFTEESIARTLNAWWPGLALTPGGRWREFDVLMLATAFDACLQTNRLSKLVETDTDLASIGEKMAKYILDYYRAHFPREHETIRRIYLAEREQGLREAAERAWVTMPYRFSSELQTDAASPSPR